MTVANKTDHALERMVFFSDAVFAIAITLLVIEIEVPRLPMFSPTSAYWHALAENGYAFGAFVLSFLVIGRFWMGHHVAFSNVRKFDPALLWPNLLMLMAIAFMPFATAFLGANPIAFPASLLYNCTMLALGLSKMWVLRIVDRKRLYADDADEAAVVRSNRAVTLAALTCVALTFILPYSSQIGMVTMPLWSRLLRKEGPKTS